ncbi:HK97 gp10 family phage protein [Lactobacillus sp. ESL0677]|uniref:HK97 gp10 family phage protein n=1 Tax=Lactobacillus sp. ESL0677 TaxID=2983208 RepID=UPI0023F62F8C|nr:HK97 gp10 family phage protein [Lactobacillus sp. ESL0677]WEV36217.1 HK97 gp10 family phage protein [Lactobacillus sp. ESL0677]
MANFEDLSNEFFKQVGKMIPSDEQKQKINMAGAKVLQQHISDAAKQKHYSNRQDEDPLHMADDLKVSPKKTSPDVNVGFENKGYIARMLNDGTKTIKGDHWYDNAFKAAKPDVFEAMKKEWESGTTNNNA